MIHEPGGYSIFRLESDSKKRPAMSGIYEIRDSSLLPKLAFVYASERLKCGSCDWLAAARTQRATRPDMGQSYQQILVELSSHPCCMHECNVGVCVKSDEVARTLMSAQVHGDKDAKPFTDSLASVYDDAEVT
jgi:hypothetical protein